jgi:hypothetical protein
MRDARSLPRDELHVRRERERGPAERAERIRERRAGAADRELVDVRRRRNERDCGSDEQIDAGERLLDALAVLLALPRGCVRLRARHFETALDLAADVLAVQLLVAGEERPVDVGSLAHEVGPVRRCERKRDGATPREVLRRRRDTLAHERLRVFEPRNSNLEL